MRPTLARDADRIRSAAERVRARGVSTGRRRRRGVRRAHWSLGAAERGRHWRSARPSAVERRCVRAHRADRCRWLHASRERDVAQHAAGHGAGAVSHVYAAPDTWPDKSKTSGPGDPGHLLRRWSHHGVRGPIDRHRATRGSAPERHTWRPHRAPTSAFRRSCASRSHRPYLDEHQRERRPVVDVRNPVCRHRCAR